MRDFTAAEQETCNRLLDGLLHRLMDVLLLGDVDPVWNQWAMGFIDIVQQELSWAQRTGYITTFDDLQSYERAVARYRTGPFCDHARGLRLAVKVGLMAVGLTLDRVLERGGGDSEQLAEAETLFRDAERLWEIAEADARKARPDR